MATLSHLHIPSAALGACVLAGVERDTRGCLLNDMQRFNHYPATPTAVISWVFEGTLHMVQQSQGQAGPLLGPALPRVTFSGPQRKPCTSWSPGPVHALSVSFYPEVLGRIMGISMPSFVDQTVALEEVAPASFQQLCQSVLGAADAAPFSVLEALMTPLWKAGGRTHPSPYLGDWVRSMATRAAHSNAGRGLRQLQRRFREWTGQSYRDLQLFMRVEEAFLQRFELSESNPPDLAAVAAAAGFSDQSHMGREVRRVTGLSPALLSERLNADEAFWYYRLLVKELAHRR